MNAAREIPAEVLVEAVEAAAARGEVGAEPVLNLLIESLLAAGELCVILRLAASRYLPF